MKKFVIISDSNDFLAVYKPAGMLSIRSRLGAEDPRPCLLTELRATYREILPVHRLDFEVSGIMLYAREADAHRRLSQLFERQSIKKTYHALTENLGTWQEPAAWHLWTSKIVKGKKRSFHAPHGKDSQTKARVFKEHGSHLEWQLQPLTGRTHQLRLELASRNLPILGDQRYGSKFRLGEPAIALIATEINFNGNLNLDKIALPATYLDEWRDTFL